MSSLLVLGMVVVTLVALGGAALLAFAAVSIDRLQAGEERVVVQQTLSRALDHLDSDVAAAAVWDQAYEKLMPGVDLAWVDTELGAYYAHNRGDDATLIFDAQDRLFYAWSGDYRRAPRELDALAVASRTLVDQVRQQERAALGKPLPTNPALPSMAKAAHGIVKANGVAYLVSVLAVTPERAATRRRPGPATLVLCAQRMDRHLLPTLRDEMRIHQPRLQAEGWNVPGAVPLTDPQGRSLGWLAWEPKQPGLQAVRRAAPLLLPGALMLIAAIVALALRIRQVLLELDTSEAGQKAALAEVVNARDRADKANLAKSQFLANISHEIRTPLNGVLGMAQVMQQGDLGSQHREHLQIIRNSGESLLAVLNDVLDISRIEAGRFELDEHVFDLAQTVGAACRAFALLADQKNVTFTTDLAPDTLGTWYGDSVRLRQVLSNLASNAVKFTDQGQIALSVSVTDDGLSFSLADTGIGVAAEHIPGLFEKFAQGDSSTTRRFGGTGLGLTICRELVDRMGGTLRMESEAGKGSTFCFRLPFKRAEAVAALLPVFEDDIRSLRILAAEDNSTNQVILRTLLKPTGVNLHTVANGEEAVHAFYAAEYDLILMDVQMPVMNGIEATRAIRARETSHGLSPTPILALTANVMSHQVLEYVQAGMDGVVAKPMDAGELIKAITAALERSATPSA